LYFKFQISFSLNDLLRIAY